MSLQLRIVLLFVSTVFLLYVISKIKKSKVKIDFTFFWILFSVLLVVLCLFPELIIYGSQIVGIISPINFLLVLIIFLLIYKVFSLSLIISSLQQKIEHLVQNMALEKKEEEDENNKCDKE